MLRRKFSVILILALLFQNLLPGIAYGEVNSEFGNEYQLYKVTEQTVVAEDITLEVETLIYGKPTANEEMIEIQYAEGYVEIPKNNVLEVEPAGDIPEFVEMVPEQNVIQKLSKDGALYAWYPDDSKRVSINEEVEYPLGEKQGIDVVILGNTEFYLTKEDRLQANEEESENNNSESPSTSPDVEDTDVQEEEKAIESDEINKEEKQRLEEKQQVIEQPIEAANESVKQPAVEEEKRTFSATAFSAKKQDPWKDSKAKYFQVTVDNLVVYAKGNTKVLGTLTKGQIYPIKADYGNWHQIQYGNTSGYVYKASTIPSQGEIKNENKSYKNSKQHFVTLQDTPVYDNSTGTLVEFGTIKKGERYPIVSDYGRNWSRIIFAGRVGYVLNSNVRHEFTGGEKYFQVLESNLPIYDNRSGSLKQVGSLTKGQEYEIVSDYGNWHRIQYNNHYGYVLKSKTEPSDGRYIRNKNKSYKHSGRTVTTLQDTIVYDNSTGKLRGFGTIKKGQSYQIAGNYGNWWRIIFADRVGYIHKNKVKFDFKNSDRYFKVQVDNLAVYDNSGSSLKKVGELQKGQVYPRVGPYGPNWHKVKFGNGFGYVYTERTELGSASQIKNKNTKYKSTNKYFRTQKDVTVYDNSTGKLVPIGVLKKDTIYPIAFDYGNWWGMVYLDRVGYVSKQATHTHTTYDITLAEAVNIQMKVNPQTDRYFGYVSKNYIKNGRVNVDSLNVRTGPGTSYRVIRSITKGTSVKILGETNGWYKVEFGYRSSWTKADREQVLYYLNPANFINDPVQQFQFLDLSRPSGASATTLNKYLKGKGILDGMGQAFIDAGKEHGINDVYLLSHALLETGNGTSELATGVNYKGKTVYNMYGIGAYDDCPVECGAKRAYEEGWTSPEAAIIGGAEFIGTDYIKIGQNTLYKMRWNYKLNNGSYVASHQYATDIGWASKQVYTMYDFYQQLDSYILYFDVPVYKN